MNLPAPVAWGLRFGLAFALLNALLTFENRWPGFGVHLNPRLSFELCLGVLALLGWVAWRGPLRARAATALALGFMALVAVRYADVTAPAVLGRPVNIYWDGRHALDLLQVLAASLSAAQLAAVATAALLAAVALTVLVRVAIQALARCLAWAPARRPLVATVAALVLCFAAYVPDGRDTRWFFALPLAPTLQQQALLMWRVLVPGQGDAVLAPVPGLDAPLAALPPLGPGGPAAGPSPGGHCPARPGHGAARAPDILLMFAESYGAVSSDLPAVAAALAAPRAELARAIADSGRGVVTARVRSPTFGGGSWLAHASLLAGLPMADPGHHALLLASRRPTLVSHLAARGYRTVAWMPGLKRAWPEGAFYGFSRVADDAAIGYTGPDFGYWRIPDQAAMAALHDQELAAGASASPDRPPRLVVFPTISTHAPFHPLPPLVADWAALSGPRAALAYSPGDAAAALAQPLALQQPLAGHIDALRYQFGWWAGYLRQRAPCDLLWVIVGDHQPPALVAGAGASWDVPVHVISSSPQLLQAFQAQGFTPGLQLPADAQGPMHGLLPQILRALAAAGPGPGRGDRQPHQACTSPEGACGGSASSQPRKASASRPWG